MLLYWIRSYNTNWKENLALKCIIIGVFVLFHERRIGGVQKSVNDADCSTLENVSAI